MLRIFKKDQWNNKDGNELLEVGLTDNMAEFFIKSFDSGYTTLNSEQALFLADFILQLLPSTARFKEYKELLAAYRDPSNKEKQFSFFKQKYLPRFIHTPDIDPDFDIENDNTHDVIYRGGRFYKWCVAKEMMIYNDGTAVPCVAISIENNYIGNGKLEVEYERVQSEAASPYLFYVPLSEVQIIPKGNNAL